MSAPSTPPTPGPVGLAREALATLDAGAQAAVQRWRRHDRLVSVWAPVAVLALVFLVYLVVVEFAVCAFLWLQPVMQAVGLVCFAWWAALVVARVAMRRWNAARKARYRADEVLTQARRLFDAHRAEVKDKAHAEVLEAYAGVLRSLGPEAEPLAQATKRMEGVVEKHLVRFRSGGWLDFMGGFGKALLIALAFRAVLIEPFKIPSGSMIPTLEEGDQIFVNKFIYGVRLPFTNYVPFVLVREPRRGDVIVFNNPEAPQFDYIKRVVGVPGDRLDFTQDGLVINGQLAERRLVEKDYRYSSTPETAGLPLSAQVASWFHDDWFDSPESLYVETFDGRPHFILDAPDKRAVKLEEMVTRSVEVPPGHVFVMGDNRNNSSDSRYGLGVPSHAPAFVPFGHIKGKATVIWLSLARGGWLSSIFGGSGVRYSRFFMPVTTCPTQPPPKPLE